MVLAQKLRISNLSMFINTSLVQMMVLLTLYYSCPFLPQTSSYEFEILRDVTTLFQSVVHCCRILITPNDSSQ